jgi:S-formylglutathione hydrolase FrmB
MRMQDMDPDSRAMFEQIFGPDLDITGTEHDLLWLLGQTGRADGPKPKLYQCCGMGDFLYQDNLNFTEACRKTNYDLTVVYDEGEHEWGYWDRHIQRVLEWLPLGGS